MRSLEFTVHGAPLAIVRLRAGAALPAWLDSATGALLCVTRTPRETSVVCAATIVPEDEEADRGWVVLELRGPFALTEVGILAAFAGPLAAAGVALFAISSFDTDYLLVHGDALERARTALLAAGHRERPA